MAGTGARPDEPSHLVVGHVSRPHGTKGDVFVWPLTDHPEDVFAEGRSVWLGDTRGDLGDDAPALTILASRPFKRGLLVAFDGVTDREAVESLAGRYVLVERSALAGPENGEWYYHQLLGMTVETVEGVAVGVVREVYETAPADLLEIEAVDGQRRLVPMSKQIVRRVDADAGTIVIEPPAGLLDL